jgi:hypothetical protein
VLVTVTDPDTVEWNKKTPAVETIVPAPAQVVCFIRQISPMTEENVGEPVASPTGMEGNVTLKRVHATKVTSSPISC